VIEDVPVEGLERRLAKVDILDPLAPEEVERLASLRSSVRLAAGEDVALDEDRWTLLLLASGRVRVHQPSPGGQDLTISMVEDGTVVGQTGFAARPSRTLRLEALQPSTLLVLGWEDFEHIVLRNPRVGVRAIRLLSVRLALCQDRLSDMVRKEVPARLADLILRLSEYESLATADGSRKIPTRYTHQQLGTMIGANREAVTRAFAWLREVGAVETKRRYIHVENIETLRAAADDALPR
jgi:CRP/FNR family transcriptional regulator, cyclic AMP receptor protein